MKATKDCKRGRFTYLSNDIFIGKSIEAYGEHSELEVQFLCSLIQPGQVVVDVGAHIGTLTVPMAEAVGPTGRVIAIEPQKELVQILAENVKQNGLEERVAIAVIALGEQVGEMALPTINYNEQANFGGASLRSGSGVIVQALDGLAMKRCDLIKIDVEGMELEVLKGARDTITRLRPFIYIENDRPEKSTALIQFIRELRYEMYVHKPWMFNDNNFAGNKENLFPNMASLNMLCVPTGIACKQAGSLQRVTSAYDKTFNAMASSKIRPANGWAGIARFGGIGDNLMAASAAGALKRKGFKVEMITSADCAWQVFEHNPNIDKLSIKTKSEMAPHGLEWQKWFRGRADEYDVFAHLSHSCEGLLAFFPASTQFQWPAHVRRQIAHKNYLEIVHDIAGCSYDFGPLFYSSDAEREHALQTKAKVGPKCIAWVLSGTRIDKVHPHAPGIIARILKEVGVPIVMLGKPGKNFLDAKAIQEHVVRTNGSDEGLHTAISADAPEGQTPVIDWPIRRALAFAQVCDLVIGPDTGIMWGVAMESMPKVMLLSHASEENITKHWIDTTTLHADPIRVPCWPCHQLHDTPETCTPNKDNNGAACMTDISADRIVRTVAELWERPMFGKMIIDESKLTIISGEKWTKTEATRTTAGVLEEFWKSDRGNEEWRPVQQDQPKETTDD